MVNYPLISIIIPTYNYGMYLPDTIKSVHGQDYKNVEIIVVDDGSKDNTADIVRRFNGVLYVYQDNQGLSAARNRGIRLAKGKYLQFLDADDLLGTTSISKRAEYLESNPNKSAVFCRSAYFERYRLPESIAFFHREWRQPDLDQLDIALHYFNIAPPHAFLIRKSSIDSSSLYFDTELKACEDYDFWLRLARKTGVPGQVCSCWVYYRQHANSMSRSYKSQYRHDAELCRRLLNYCNVDDSWPHLVKRPDAEYFAAMLAAALRTARRFWNADRSGFDNFLHGHIWVLRDKLIAAQSENPVRAAGFIYLSISRLTLCQMTICDHSVESNSVSCLNKVLGVNASFFLRLIESGFLFSSFYTAIRLLKLDLHYFILLSTATNASALSVGGLLATFRLALISIYQALFRRQ